MYLYMCVYLFIHTNLTNLPQFDLLCFFLGGGEGGGQLHVCLSVVFHVCFLAALLFGCGCCLLEGSQKGLNMFECNGFRCKWGKPF